MREKKEKSLFWKYILPSVAIVGGFAVTVYLIYKGNKNNQLPTITVNLPDFKPEKTFANISENTLNRIIKEEVPRGMKVNIEGNSLLMFRYKSASGKANQRAQFIYDSINDELRYLGDSRANVPRIFYEKLRSAINSLKIEAV